MLEERIGKYLSVQEVPNPGRKTRVWHVLGSVGVQLGLVRWYSSWRQYVFEPKPDTVFNKVCLGEMSVFLDEQNKAHRAGLASDDR